MQKTIFQKKKTFYNKQMEHCDNISNQVPNNISNKPILNIKREPRTNLKTIKKIK